MTTNAEQTSEAVKELKALYVDAQLHCEYDFRITISGNRQSASSVIDVLDYVFFLLGVETPDVSEEDRKAFEEEHGVDEDE